MGGRVVVSKMSVRALSRQNSQGVGLDEPSQELCESKE